MAWTKSPEALINTFSAALPEDPRAERRRMFGYPCSFTNGNMFAGLHQDKMILRLSEEDRAALLRTPGASIFEPMAGRPMREYVAVPPSLLADPAGLREWTGKAFSYGLSLKPKEPKPKKSAAAGKSNDKKPARRPSAGT